MKFSKDFKEAVFCTVVACGFLAITIAAPTTGTKQLAPKLPGQTTNTLTVRREAFEKEYQRTAQQVEAGRQQMLRLEGAIRALEIVDAETSATENGK